MAGVAALAATGAAGLTGVARQMQVFVTDKTGAIEAEPGLVQRRLQQADGRVPVHRDDAFALAPLDQQLEPLHRCQQHQPLHPFDPQPECVFVPEITCIDFKEVSSANGGGHPKILTCLKGNGGSMSASLRKRPNCCVAAK